MTNKLFFGDCLDVMRTLPEECCDLIYLDPPFNSNATYNLLFASPAGDQAIAQIEAFDDTWHWGEQSAREFRDIQKTAPTDVSNMLVALVDFLGKNDVTAYLTMMTSRLLEIRRLMKDTASIYLHCDPTASHYLKIVLDGVFGKRNYRNEIVWCYSTGGASKRFYAKKHDTIFFYTKSDEYKFYPDRVKEPRTEKSVKRAQNPKGARITSENTDKLPTDVFQIQALNPMSKERIGYPTQKPLALLDRIVLASSDEGDVVLDPFCGCGTAVHSAQKNGRSWMGIDITHLAVSLIERRLRDAFPECKFDTLGTPKDFESAANLAERDKYQFQWWALSLIDAQPYKDKKKGADGGIDGQIFFDDDGSLRKILVSVKGGMNVSVSMIRDLIGTIKNNKADIGIFLTLTKPTKPMVVEALNAGFYESEFFSDKEYPRIQILTIEGLMNGTERPLYPDLTKGGYNFKKAQKEKEVSTQHTLGI